MASPHHIAPPASTPNDAPPPASGIVPVATKLTALGDEDLLVVNLDIPTLVARIFSHAPELRLVETDVQARQREPGPPGRVERLEQYASQLREVHGACLELQARLPSPSSLAEELAKQRQRLLGAASALVRLGVLRVKPLEPYLQVRSHRSLARSVCGIAGVLLAHWELIRGHTPVQTADLERALLLAREFSELLLGKHGGGEALATALRQRQQLFTRLLKEYAELRRAAQLLYGPEQAQRRVPSLYGKSSSRRSRGAARATLRG